MYHLSGFLIRCPVIVHFLQCNQSDYHYKRNPDVHVHHTTVSSLGDIPSWVAIVISLISSDSESELFAEVVPGFWNKRKKHIHTYTHTVMCAHTRVCVHFCVCVCMCMWAHTHVCVYEYMCAC